MAEAQALITAFLTVHAQGAPLPAALYAKGEALWRDLRDQAPPTADWGRFLVALGQLAADHLHDERAAYTWFRQALDSVRSHGDLEVACAASYDLAVLLERKGNLDQAQALCRQAATQAIAARSWSPATLRCIEAVLRLVVQADASLDDGDRRLLKQAWLAWLHGMDGIDGDLDDRLLRTLAVFLLPEDDPSELLPRWRSWPPAHLDHARNDSDPHCLAAVLDAAVRAADLHLRDEPGQALAYRHLREAWQRSRHDQDLPAIE